jgi:hypothetical protein
MDVQSVIALNARAIAIISMARTRVRIRTASSLATSFVMAVPDVVLWR